jgi:hypothetical protein
MVCPPNPLSRLSRIPLRPTQTLAAAIRFGVESRSPDYVAGRLWRLACGLGLDCGGEHHGRPNRPACRAIATEIFRAARRGDIEEVCDSTAALITAFGM